MVVRLSLVMWLVASSVGVAAKPEPPAGDMQVGKASYYAQRFAGRTMANGEPMRPDSNNAASRTLPLGTVARVTNLANGRSAVVEITDRGPYVKGRIVDLSPRTAKELDMREAGIVPVVVEPLSYGE